MSLLLMLLDPLGQLPRHLDLENEFHMDLLPYLLYFPLSPLLVVVLYKM
jgi:hypothetical protein